MAESSGSRKRSRPSRACRLCLSCKTKCDNVTSLGCRRCREKKRLCSLIEDGSPPTTAQAPPPHRASVDPTIAGVTPGMDRMAQGLDILSYASTTPMPATTWPTPSSSSSAPLGLDVQSISFTSTVNQSGSQFPHMRRIIDSTEWDERFFSTTQLEDFPDVVQLGLLTEEQVDHAYMIFQRRFTQLMVLPPYCDLTTERESHHPFFTLATLAYTPWASSIPLSALISQSIYLVMTGAASLDAVRALFLLSLAPILPEAAQRSQMTSGWYLELAHSMGNRLGLQDMAQSLSDGVSYRSKTLSQIEHIKTLEVFLLWENIKVRLNIVSLMSTRIGNLTLRDSLSHHLPKDHPREAYRVAISQNRLCSNLVDVFSPFLEVWVEEENEGLIVGPDAKRDREAWVGMESEIKRLMGDPATTELIRCDVACARHGLASRVAAHVRRIPTPFSPDIVGPFLQMVGVILFPALRTMLDSCARLSDDQLLHLPSYLTTSYAYGMILIRRVMSFVPAVRDDPQRNDKPELQLVDVVEERLSKAGSYQAMIISKGKEALDYVALPNQGAVMGNPAHVDPWGGFTFMDLDLSMFDWSTLGVQPGT